MKVFEYYDQIKNAGELRMYSALTCRPVNASIRFGDGIVAKIKINPQLLCKNAAILLYNEDNNINLEYETYIEDDVFMCQIDTKNICCDSNALLFIAVRLDTIYGQLYLTRQEDSFFLTDSPDNAYCYQMTVYTSDFETPDFIKGGLVYQIMVDRFRIGGKRIKRKDAVNVSEWNSPIPQFAENEGEAVENNCFYGGNLKGVEEKLSYLKTLGVTCIYLCPVFEAYSNHKYDTGNFMSVDRCFGGDEALKSLISAAKEYGISIVLDGVFNHTGNDSLYFNAKGKYDSLGAYQSDKSPYYNWYTFYDFPHEYRCWWGIKTLPAVDTENDEYINFICGENGVLNKYMNMGIKGFRLDVADELSNKFIKALRNSVKKKDSNAIIWGEVWEDASNKISYGKRRQYFRGNQLDGVMNYPLRDAIIQFLLYSNSKALGSTTRKLWYNYPEFVSHTLLNFLGTHDTARIITVLSGADISQMSGSQLVAFKLTQDQKNRGEKLLRLAYILLFTLPGVPCIFYGDEVGVEGARDPFNRTTFPWENENTALKEYVTETMKIRRQSDVFSTGDFEILEESGGVFSFIRRTKNEECIVCINRSQTEYTLFFDNFAIDKISGKTFKDYAVILPDNAIILFYDKNEV